MNRRGFLKRTGQGCLAGFLAVTVPVAVQAGALAVPSPAQMGSFLYKGTVDGQILESGDGGATWHTRANFGADFAIRQVVRSGDRLYAEVGFQGHSFMLKSQDGGVWFTADWVPA